jgi:acetyl esterase/lipase
MRTADLNYRTEDRQVKRRLIKSVSELGLCLKSRESFPFTSLSSLTSLTGPLHIASTLTYPPTCQVMGDNDEIFQISHVHKFHSALEATGVECRKVVVPGMGHAFDNWESIGGEMDREVIGPAVDWVVKFSNERSAKVVVEEKEVPREKEGKKKRNWFGWLKWVRRR